MKSSILNLTPHYVYKIWGGEKLQSLLGASCRSEPLGEAWIVSRLKNGASVSQEGPLDKVLSSQELPYLVKLIDTSDHLSVQVHPGDVYAEANEGGVGKAECWVILDHVAGAGIYLGMKQGVTRDVFYRGVLEGDDISKFLQFREVSRGEFYFVPEGSIHAIGKGVTLAEVQQSSGITYRVWDWNRINKKGEGRELHIKKAMDVISFEEKKNTNHYFQYKKNIFKKEGPCEVTCHKDFSLSSIYLNKGEKMTFKSTSQRVSSLLVIEGDMDIVLEGEREVTTLSEYKASLVRLGYGYDIIAKSNLLFLRIS